MSSRARSLWVLADKRGGYYPDHAPLPEAHVFRTRASAIAADFDLDLAGYVERPLLTVVTP